MNIVHARIQCYLLAMPAMTMLVLVPVRAPIPPMLAAYVTASVITWTMKENYMKRLQ